MDPEGRVRRSLSQFENDLWLDRRLKLAEILEHLDSIRQGSDSTLRDSAEGWIRFFEFLGDECCGLNYSCDKQWGELLILMQISRKLNHRTVRLTDVLRSREAIECNAKSIRMFNKVATLSQTIEVSLAKLEESIALCQLILPTLPADDSFMVNELQSSMDCLQQTCRQPICTLKMELCDNLIAKRSTLELWRSRLGDMETIVIRLAKFLSNLLEFQTNLIKLKPLMISTERANDELSQGNLSGPIGSCKGTYSNAREFQKKLVQSLSKINQRKFERDKGIASIQLKLILKSTGEYLHEIYGDGLVKELDNLNRCITVLDRMMQELRLEFGRFYFVNDVELLTIISLNLQLVRDGKSTENKRLISKLFTNSVCEFEIAGNNLVGIWSPMGEFISFHSSPIQIKKEVNVYSVEIIRIFNEILRKLRSTLSSILFKSLAESSSIDWSLPVQLIYLAEQVKFCSKVEDCLKGEGDLNKLEQFYELRLADLSIRSGEKSDWLESFKTSAAISMTVQQMSILVKLNSENVKDVCDWNWQKRSRYYVTGAGRVLEVCIADSKFAYRFDYLPLQMESASGRASLGSFKRLIDTRVTERCFLAASQANCDFRLGANPQGPAGCGKTETIKALGYSIGCQVIVHNCDESNDSNSLDSLIWGLTHTGLWGCFDEFNRLNESVLSATSATLELVQTSLREGKSTVQLADGRTMCLDPASAFFITLNPGDASRYRGRRQLPTNIRALFVPISMVLTQVDSIVGEKLLVMASEMNWRRKLKPGEAFEFGRQLSRWLQWTNRRLVHCAARCEWDLRLVMAILRRLKLLSLQSEDVDVRELLVRSIEREVVSRLTQEERQLFRESIEENFSPGTRKVIHSIEEESNLSRKLDRTISELSEQFQSGALIKSRALDLMFQLETRVGVLLLGPPSSGKSTTWKVLASTLGDSVRWFAINPGAYNKQKLFGFVDPVSRKWVDGIMAAKVRHAIEILQSEELKTEQVWLILDGPIDPDWIESLNSVLDDNQILTLSSGERLEFSLRSNKSIKLIFEATDAKLASPATISRLGLIYHERLSSFAPSRKLELCPALQAREKEPQLNQGQKEAANGPPSSDETARKIVAEFLAFDEEKLLIVATQDTCNLYKLFQSVGVVDSGINEPFTEYRCSPDSSSVHLVEFVEANQHETLMILHNIHLIASDSKWNTSSLVEMLRFMLTYDGYYSSRFDFVSLRAKFVLLVENLEDVNERMVSLGKAIQLCQADLPQASLTHLEKLDLEFINSPGSAVITISSSQLGAGIRRELMEKFSGRKILGFRNTREALQSMENLSEICDGNITSGSGFLFILSSVECRLLGPELRSRLFHKLNSFRNYPKGGQLILIDLDATKNPTELTFWRSMGSIVHLSSRRERMIEAAIAQFRSLLLAYRMQCNQVDDVLNLVTKFLQTLPECRLLNQRYSDSFSNISVSLIDKLSSRLTSRRRLLTGGLSRLTDVGRCIEQMKLNGQHEEDKLRAKKQEIGKLMESIDSALEVLQFQRNEVANLRSHQEERRAEIARKRVEIESELSKVKPLVDSSKSEILQHLKPEALNEIRTMRAPPETVKDILDVLFVLLGGKDTSWTSIKSHLARCSLREELVRYQFKEKLSKPLLSKAESMIERKQTSFSKQQAARASSAIVPILHWIEATLKYGRVLIKLNPLEEELITLEEELSRITKLAESTENELGKIDCRMEQDSLRLRQLNDESDSSQQVLLKLKNKLDEAESANLNLANQIVRWKCELDSIESMLVGNELVKLCLFASSVAIFYTDDEDFENWQTLFGLVPTKRAAIIDELLTLLDENHHHQPNRGYKGINTEDNGGKLRESKTGKLLQLLILKLCLECDSSSKPSRLIPFLDLGCLSSDNDSPPSDRELKQILGFNSILRPLKDIATIRCAEISETKLIQSMELAVRLKKLLVIELRELESSQDLDILDLALGGHETDGVRLILVGRLNQHPAITQFLRPINLLLANNLGEQEIELNILNYLVEFYDPELGESMAELEESLRLKLYETSSMEQNLLEKLAISRGETNLEGSDIEVQDGLIEVLSGLDRLNKSAATCVSQLESKLLQLSQKQTKYSSLSSKAAQFYRVCLAPLQAIDKFYHISLDRYSKMLLKEREQLGAGREFDCSIDVEFFARQVIRSMRPACRLNFQRKLQDQQVGLSTDIWPTNAKLTSQCVESELSEIVVELFEMDNASGASKSTIKLMIVLHDPTKSSPQGEIDELFRQRESKALNKEASHLYKKMYATCEPSKQFQLEFTRFVHSDWHDKDQRIALKATTTTETSTRCLCIANAHLSHNWINTQLLALLEEAELFMGSTDRLQVILVGESAPRDAAGFDSSVLNYAQFKYWYDELAFSLTHRFRLLSNFVLNSFEISPSNIKTSDSIMDKQLILFHVVCQERSRTSENGNGGQPTGWCSYYSFDNSLLTFAFQKLRRLQQVNSDEIQVRALLCRYLENVFYGARLERREDELALRQLTERFLGSLSSGRDQLTLLKRLESLVDERRNEAILGPERDEILDKLTGLA